MNSQIPTPASNIYNNCQPRLFFHTNQSPVGFLNAQAQVYYYLNLKCIITLYKMQKNLMSNSMVSFNNSFPQQHIAPFSFYSSQQNQFNALQNINNTQYQYQMSRYNNFNSFSQQNNWNITQFGNFNNMNVMANRPMFMNGNLAENMIQELKQEYNMMNEGSRIKYDQQKN